MSVSELWIAPSDAPEQPLYRLDPLDLSLWHLGEVRKGRRVPLMPRTFDVLHFLVRHPGRLVTHDELLQGVWGDEAVQPEVLKTHVHAIRQALEEGGEMRRFIETERGRGYRFIGLISRGMAMALPEAVASHGGLPGRAKAFAALRSAKSRADQGAAQLVLVDGEAGIGKTALIEAFLNESLGFGQALVAWGHCIEGFFGREPYYPLLEALESLCHGEGGQDIAGMVATLAPTWAAQLVDAFARAQSLQLRSGLANPQGMLREVLHLLKAIGQNRLIVLVLEDLHWSDHATLEALYALFRAAPRARLLVMASFRIPDLAEDETPLQRMLRELAVKNACTHLRLLPLSEQDVGEVLDPRGQAEPELARLLTLWSGGNPLFLRMTLAHLHDQGKLQQTDSGWRMVVALARLSFDAPPPLGDFIRGRVSLMPAVAQRVLRAASAYGNRFSPAMLATAAGVDSLECESICRALVATVLRDDGASADVPPNTVFSFQHALYRHAVYEGLGPLHRQKLHRQLAEALEEQYLAEGRSDLVVPLFQQFELARDWSRALRYAEAALQICDRRHARQDALAIVGDALRLVAEIPAQGRAAQELRLLDRKASLQAASHDGTADTTFAQMVALGEREQNIEVQIKGLLGLAYIRSWHDADASQHCLDAVLRLSSEVEDPVKRNLARLSAHTRRVWTSGWDRQALEACERALAAIQRQGSALAVAEGLMMFGMMSMISGQYTQTSLFITSAYKYITAPSTQALKPDLVRAAWVYYVGLPWALLYKGDPEAAAAVYSTGLALFRQRADAAAFRSLSIYRSTLAYHCLAYDRVIEANASVIEEASGEQATPSSHAVLPVELRIALIYSGLAHMERGEWDLAQERLDAAQQEMARHRAHLDWYWRLHLDWGLVGMAIKRDPALARRRAEQLVAAAAATEEWTWRALALDALARASLAEGDLQEASGRIAQALNLCDSRETVLARWRVLRTAATVAERTGQPDLALRHRQRSDAERDRFESAFTDQPSTAPS